jgi:hypothetical protein
LSVWWIVENIFTTRGANYEQSRKVFGEVSLTRLVLDLSRCDFFQNSVRKPGGDLIDLDFQCLSISDFG